MKPVLFALDGHDALAEHLCRAQGGGWPVDVRSSGYGHFAIRRVQREFFGRHHTCEEDGNEILALVFGHGHAIERALSSVPNSGVYTLAASSSPAVVLLV